MGQDALMNDLSKAEAVFEDKAYDADERMRDKLKAIIPSKRNRLNPIPYDKHLYKSRHLIENVFAKLKQYRAIATRYDKTSQNFLGSIHLASAVLWLNLGQALAFTSKTETLNQRMLRVVFEDGFLRYHKKTSTLQDFQETTPGSNAPIRDY